MKLQLRRAGADTISGAAVLYLPAHAIDREPLQPSRGIGCEAEEVLEGECGLVGSWCDPALLVERAEHAPGAVVVTVTAIVGMLGHRAV